ncbi:thiamine pyrophosphate-binding protein [Roseomonas haemaphysalidis]|uniref:Thiamine pyrophosphate-binding protein n=1 Tax=Roseomonas haemaphysalidis TaxID=2768162 RepID=A0ABS3KY35_9PROT|nr:thiamine pyrophosphate-binding protein [Roseomonas haemaphysalidis]MBO1081246.1 thiamine pyrophosphate-binding protein [Roseomonas haemaphysalidis]
MNAPRTGGQILVDQLVAQGVGRVTCVPGESYLAVLDALHDASIDVITCRAEGGAAIMAEAEGKLTGRPGICMVTRGPGATNASCGVHIAMQDSTPMILFVGQVARDMREREAFQELDYRAVFGTMAKWATEIDSADRVPEIVSRAFHVAMQGRPGPVVIALPEDMLTEMASVADAPRVQPALAAPAEADLQALAGLLSEARKPLVILGGSGWDAAAVDAMATFADNWSLPVCTSFRRTDRFRWDHRCYVGDLGIGPSPGLATMVREADLLLLLGGRMSEMPSGSYSLLDIPVPKQKLIHLHPGAEELGRVYAPALAIQSSPRRFAPALAMLSPNAAPAWSADIEARHAAYLEWSGTPRSLPGRFQYGEIIRWLNDRLPGDTILCNGAGNFAGWMHRHWRFSQLGTQLAPTSGSMGYGVPAAIMAKRHAPGAVALAIAGDGDFLMTGQEFATAVQHDIPVLIIVIDNGMYGTIRMHQERDYPGRISATRLRNPDFAAYANAFGGHGETVWDTAEFAPAFERALASGRPAILHCFLDPRARSVGRDMPEGQPL